MLKTLQGRVIAKVAFIFFSLSLLNSSSKLLTAGAASLATAPSHQQIAAYYAPWWYQDVNLANRRADYITNVDFDGDWQAGNNKQNLTSNLYPLKAFVYYSVTETETHWFVVYADFHPWDWKDVANHENDLEGALLVIKKDPLAPFGHFAAMATMAHTFFVLYDGTEVLINSEGGGVHPELYVEEKGHGVYARDNWDYGSFEDDTGVIYKPAGAAAQPLGAQPIEYVSYQLVSMTELWSRRNDAPTFNPYGVFASNESSLNKAKAPWCWDDNGQFFTWPAEWSKTSWPALSASISTHYCYNPYRPEVITDGCSLGNTSTPLPQPNATPTPLPPGTVDCLRLLPIPAQTVQKGQPFSVQVTYEVVCGQLLESRGDHLYGTDPNNGGFIYGAYFIQPIVGMINPGQQFKFSFNLTAPQQTGNFATHWRIKINGNYVGPEAIVPMTVQAPDSSGVYVYASPGYGNPFSANSLTQDLPNLAAALGATWHDNIESLKVVGSFSYVLYADENYGGSHVYQNGSSDLGAWRNQADSIRIRNRDNWAFALYSLGDFNGEPWESDRTIFDLSHWEWNDRAESLKVASGFQAIACTDADFHGNCGRSPANGPAQYGDINSLASGLRQGVSSVRVCPGSCPAGAASPTLVYPSDGQVINPSSSLLLQWGGGSGDQYLMELWGGAIGGDSNNPAQRRGWTSDTQSNAGQLPASTLPYTWRVKANNGYGDSQWTQVSFVIQVPTPCNTAGYTASSGINLALNKPATSSSATASLALDGDLNTRWSSALSDPQWFQVDLGASYSIQQIVLHWEAAYGKGYQIEISNDAANWTLLYQTTTGDGGLDELPLTTPATARYVRLVGIQRINTSWGYSLWEMEVFSPPLSNLALVAGVTASSAQGSLATDGDLNSRWSSATSDPQWIQVDLGTIVSLQRVVLCWEAAYGKNYQIQVSTDAANWTTLYTTSTGDGGLDDLTLSGTGRYVRLLGLQRINTEWGYSLWEFQIYGLAVNTAMPTISPTATATRTPTPVNTPTPTPPATSTTSVTPSLSTNLALNKSAITSSGAAALAFDGDVNTRWSSATSDPQSIQVDLGALYSIQSFVLRWEAAYATAYRIEVSSDSVTWSAIFEVVSGDGGVDDLVVATPVNGRYVRLLGTQRINTSWGYSLWEFEVYSGSTPPANLALYRVATASSAIAGLALDGNLNTRWSSATSDPQWIQIDLGTIVSLQRVVLCWEAAYGKAYRIEASTDATIWATLYTTTTSDGGKDDLTLAGNGRYVRVYGTQRFNMAWGYSLWELQVYATSSLPFTPVCP
jgi:hypothetical protein